MLIQIKNNLKELGFSTNEIKAYIALTELGESTAAKIAKKIDLPRTTVIGILNQLKNQNLITTNKYRGKIFYWIESPKILQEIYQNKVKIATQIEESLSDLYRTEPKFPTAEIYDTKSSIKNFIEKFLLDLKKNDTIYTIDSPHGGNYQKITSDNIRQIMIDIKTKKNIITHTLIPNNSFKTISADKITRQDIKIRELPEGINYQSSIWLTAKYLVHFSGQPPFVVAIKNKTIIDGMQSIFNHLWDISITKN